MLELQFLMLSFAGKDLVSEPATAPTRASPRLSQRAHHIQLHLCCPPKTCYRVLMERDKQVGSSTWRKLVSFIDKVYATRRRGQCLSDKLQGQHMSRLERDPAARRWNGLHAAARPLRRPGPALQSPQAEAEVHPEVEAHQAKLCCEEGVQGGGGQGHCAGSHSYPPLHLFYP